MPYIKLSEYTAKKIYDQNWPIINLGNSSDEEIRLFIEKNDKVVVKVDQYVKRRGKKGLIQINTSFEKIKDFISEKSEYTNFILEKQIPIEAEKYFCIKLDNRKKQYIYNDNGGIHCDNPYQNAQITYSLDEIEADSRLIPVFQKLDKMFDNIFANMLEVNPIVLSGDNFYPVDFAVEVDSCGVSFLPQEYQKLIESQPNSHKNSFPIEDKIKEFDESTGASLKFTVLNSQGRILTLIAGGGASVLYTDAIVNRGYSHELHNYGEYSGNPTEEEVMQYCSYIFDHWFSTVDWSKEGMNPILFIGGGISNFTDVAKTFKGIISAIKIFASLFLEKKVQIWVRRGGVNEKEGLRNLEKEVSKLNIPIVVKGNNSPITQIVTDALPLLPKSQNVIPKADFSFEKSFTKEINIWNEKIVFVNNNTPVIQRIIDYDYYCGKNETDVLCIFDPFSKKDGSQTFYWGVKRISIPITSNVANIGRLSRGKTLSIYNYASIRSCENITKRLAELPNSNTFYLIAEGLPERKAIELDEFLQLQGKTLLGPSSVGAVKSGSDGQRIGSVGGLIDNIKRCNLSTKGNVAIITKSGGLLNEMINFVSNLGLHVGEACSIGGDRFPGITFADLVNYYADREDIELIILVGETGGTGEVDACKFNKKNVIAWCSGTSEKCFSESIEFGHAGASATSELEEASVKNHLMAKYGFNVPETFEQIGDLILSFKEKLSKINENQGREVPQDIGDMIKNGQVRINPSFVTNVSDERTDLKYRGELVENIVTKDFSIGYTIGSLWLNIKMDPWATSFLEKIIVLMADHGPAVSGAQNTIITARAGKNLTESLSAGILTIGPRFGGAISQSAVDFYDSFLRKEGAKTFVERMKNEGKYIMGIGHRVKSKFNPDKRVELIKELVKNSFPTCELLNYALEIEKETLAKKANLILNVDGAIGASLIDMILNYKTHEETKKLITSSDIFNGFFVLARTIGMIGHYQEQKVQNNGLFRANSWDVEYI